MTYWLGIGASDCWMDTVTESKEKTLAIQLPSGCLIDNEGKCYVSIMQELKNMCFSHIIISKDDRDVRCAKLVGWDLSQLIIKIGTDLTALRELKRYVDTGDESEFMYPLHYECGMVYVPPCGWYKLLGLEIPDSTMSLDRLKTLTKAYDAKVREIQKLTLSTNCDSGLLTNIAEHVTDQERLSSCIGILMDEFVKHLNDIYDYRSTETYKAPYSIWFDEPQKSTSYIASTAAELKALQNHISKQAQAGNPFYRGSDYRMSSVISNYEDMELWSRSSDYLFPNYYKDPIVYDRDFDQTDEWEKHKGMLKGKMDGAFINMILDHVGWMGYRDYFYKSEVQKLFQTANNLGLHQMWIFPGSEGTWQFYEKYLFPEVPRCKLFLQYAKEICDIAVSKGWPKETSTATHRLYCVHFPDCNKCDKSQPFDTSQWSTKKPNNFPDIDELMAGQLGRGGELNNEQNAIDFKMFAL